MLAPLFLLSFVSSALAIPHSTVLARSPNTSNIIQMFEWTWDSIASECAYIGSAGYGYVQVGVAAEHITGPQWWTDYQITSYTIQSKRGSRSEFQAMVNTCHSVGVKVIVDTVFNHMAGVDSGSGVAGTQFTHYNYPGTYQSQNFHYCGTPNNAIQDFNNEQQLETCQLENLADLDTGSEFVRSRLAQYGNDLLSLGVDGLRLDAAKHVSPTDLQNILNRLSRQVYITQEVVDTNGQFSSIHASAGQVQEFRYAYALLDAFTNSGISALQNVNSRGWLPSNSANVFVANHDTERESSTLSYKSANNMYTLAHVFMLSYPYGTPTILSSYQFSDNDAGPPSAGAGACSGTGPTNGWECQHRWTAIIGMVGFYNTVGGAGISDIFTTSNQAQLAFGRGPAGYVAINNADSTWQASFKTSLPNGSYCDVVGGQKESGACSGQTITIASGSFSFSIPSRSAVAIHTGSKL